MHQLDEKLLFLDSKITNQKDRIDYLKKGLSERNGFYSNPPLVYTSIGRSSRDGKVTYRNWQMCTGEGWFTRFLKNKFGDMEYNINFFGPIGTHENIADDFLGKKVFWSGEDLNIQKSNPNKRFEQFNEKFGAYALDYVDLAMGYDLMDHPKYIRFPLWIPWNFESNMTEEEIEEIFNNWNNTNFKKTQDTTIIASHDNWNMRTFVINTISQFTKIKYAGKWRNNTSELWGKYQNDKIEYLKQFKFNILGSK